jgi:hypothetical protein
MKLDTLQVKLSSNPVGLRGTRGGKEKIASKGQRWRL